MLAGISTKSGADSAGKKSKAFVFAIVSVSIFALSTLPVLCEDAVLDPNKFTGHAKSGYAAAQLCPEICAKLFCYCGCDLTDEHDSLLDCFTTDHGVDCRICQEEALIALKMKREGKTIEQIQQKIDLMFEKEYPFNDEPSAIIKKYRENRLWQPKSNVTDNAMSTSAPKAGAKISNANSDKANAGKGNSGNASASTRPKTAAELAAIAKRKAEAGACCRGKGHAK